MSLIAISCIGNIIATSTTKLGPRFLAMFLMTLGAVASYQIIVAWVANSFAGPLVKVCVLAFPTLRSALELKGD